MLSLGRLGPYLAEMVGAFALVFAGFGAIVIDTTSHGQITHVGVAISFGLVIVLTFFLMFVIMAVATDDRAVGKAAALAIGGTVLLDAMFGGPISGASMNPARSLGPALASGTWPHLWIYIAGPLIGAVLGAFSYELVRGEHPRPGLPSGGTG